MKKIFTLISMAFVAMSVNAQDSWTPDVDYVAAPWEVRWQQNSLLQPQVVRTK